MSTYEANTRAEFAAYLRAYRAAGLIRTYGRLHSFGRSLITVDGLCIRLHRWTPCPPMNIHY